MHQVILHPINNLQVNRNWISAPSDRLQIQRKFPSCRTSKLDKEYIFRGLITLSPMLACLWVSHQFLDKLVSLGVAKMYKSDGVGIVPDTKTSDFLIQLKYHSMYYNKFRRTYQMDVLPYSSFIPRLYFPIQARYAIIICYYMM